MRFLLFLSLLLISQDSWSAAWSQKANFPAVARHRTTSVTIGNKIYMGLGHYNGAGLNVLFDDWWEYDPATNAWTQKADYLGGICYHAAAFTIDNIAYVGTGRITSVGSTLVSDFHKYDATTNTWTATTPLPTPGRRGGVSFVIDGMGYVGTGENFAGNLADFYRFDPSAETWTAVASLPADPRISSVSFAIDGFGYVGTGDTDLGSTNDFWQYDPTADTWTQKPIVGPVTRQEAIGFAVDGMGYIGTGVDTEGGNNFRDMWEYDPTAEAWVQIDDFPGTARRYFSGTVLGSIAYAGLGTNGTNFNDFWVFDHTLHVLEKNLEQLEINAFPNPSADVLHFDTDLNGIIAPSELTVHISSVEGKIWKKTPLNKQLSIDVSELPQGNYFCSFEYNNTSVLTKQITIQR